MCFATRKTPAFAPARKIRFQKPDDWKTKQGMNNQRQGRNTGGRPIKESQDKASEKINCWVTPAELNQLVTAYEQAKAGRKLAFSTFLKTILMSKRQSLHPKTDELLLTIIIQLQQQSEQLSELKNTVGMPQAQRDNPSISDRVDEALSRLRGTLNQITTWLYES